MSQARVAEQLDAWDERFAIFGEYSTLMSVLKPLQRVDITTVVRLVARAVAIVVADVEGFVACGGGGKTIFGCAGICGIDAAQEVGLREELSFGESYGILVLNLNLWRLGSA